MVHSMVQIFPELPTYSIQWWALFAPLAKHFTMEKLQKLSQDNIDKNKSMGRDQFCCGHSDFAFLFEGRNIMPTVISYQRYSLESTKRNIMCTPRPDTMMTISRGTVKFKLDRKDVLLPLIMRNKRQTYIPAVM